MPPDPISDPVCVAEAADEARLYRSMRLVRRAEEVIADIYPSDKIKSPVHLSIGQEAVAVAVCDGLRPDDVVAGSYRGHALYLAKGGDVPAMMAEMFGKIGGCARQGRLDASDRPGPERARNLGRGRHRNSGRGRPCPRL